MVPQAGLHSGSLRDRTARTAVARVAEARPGRAQAVAHTPFFDDSTSDPTLTAVDGAILLAGLGTVSIDHCRSGEGEAVEEQSQQADIADLARFGYKQELRMASHD